MAFNKRIYHLLCCFLCNTVPSFLRAFTAAVSLFFLASMYLVKKPFACPGRALVPPGIPFIPYYRFRSIPNDKEYQAELKPYQDRQRAFFTKYMEARKTMTLLL